MRFVRVLGVVAALALALPSAAAAQRAKRFSTPTHSSPITMSRDGRFVWSVNPNDNSVSVIRTAGNRVVAKVKVGRHPQSVAVTPDGRIAFVSNAASGTVTVIRVTNPNPRRFRARRVRSLRTGAEPAGVVVAPNGRLAFVANAAQDTVTAIDARRGRVLGHVNLRTSRCNAPDVERLFQPRGLAVTRNSRRLYVTSFLSYVRRGSRQMVDTGREATVCRLEVRLPPRRRARRSVTNIGTRITIGPQPTGFAVDRTGDAVPDPTAAFPNQLQSVVIRGNQAFLPNIAASPEGPLRFNVDTEAFVNVLDGVNSGRQRDASATRFLNLHLGARDPEPGKTKLFFANVWGIGFTNQRGSGNAYVVSAGSDLLVKVNVSSSGKLSFTVDQDTTRYIDLNNPANPATAGNNAGKNPIGIAITPNGRRAYVNNFVSGNVSVVNLRTDAVIDTVRTTPLPAPGSQAERNRVGAEIFFSSRGHFNPPPAGTPALPGRTVSFDNRLSSEGWQSCSSCHFEGWTDGVIWQFGAGPRKSVPLNTSFNPNNPADQRVLNYSAIFDEVEDFELNIRNVSGPGPVNPPGPCDSPPPPVSNFDPNHGLLIGDGGNANDVPCVINAFGKANAGRPQLTVTLPGSTTAVPALTAMKEWVQGAIRTPEGALTGSAASGGLSAPLVNRGRQVFVDAGCNSCHGGPKWTISTKDFTSPPAAPEIATETNPPPRFGNPIGAQYLNRFLRDVGTYKIGVPDRDYAAATVAADEKASQALVDGRAGRAPDGLGIDFNGDGKGFGFNVPSLLGVGLTPPYYHGGGCETLQCVVDDVRHRTANGRLPDRLTNANDRRALVAFLRTIDADTPAP